MARARTSLVVAGIVAMGLGRDAAAREPAGSVGATGDAATSRAARKRALRLTDRAKALYAKKRWDDAIVAFKLAYQEDPQPTLLFNIGRCYERKGDLFKAMEHVEAYMQSTQDEEAREDAKDLRDILRGKLVKTSGELRVVSAPAGATVVIRRDGREHTGTTPWTRWLPAGTWQVTVALDGHEPWRDDVTLAVGGSVKRDVTLQTRQADGARRRTEGAAEPAEGAGEPAEEAPEAAHAASPGLAEHVITEAPSSSPEQGSGDWVPLAAGVSALALLAGGVLFGVFANQAEADLAEMKDARSEFSKIELTQQTAESRALVANLLFVAGGLAGATGAALVFLGGQAEASAAPSGLLLRGTF